MKLPGATLPDAFVPHLSLAQHVYAVFQLIQPLSSLYKPPCSPPPGTHRIEWNRQKYLPEKPIQLSSSDPLDTFSSGADAQVPCRRDRLAPCHSVLVSPPLLLATPSSPGLRRRPGPTPV
jgi:hypothetical protein